MPSSSLAPFHSVFLLRTSVQFSRFSLHDRPISFLSFIYYLFINDNIVSARMRIFSLASLFVQGTLSIHLKNHISVVAFILSNIFLLTAHTLHSYIIQVQLGYLEGLFFLYRKFLICQNCFHFLKCFGCMLLLPPKV